jgi:hypothetical protein
MNIQKLVNAILNYFSSKFFLEHNLKKAFFFEELQKQWNILNNSILITSNFKQNSKSFSIFIVEFKKIKIFLENRNDISLYNNLLSFLFLVRLESNKQKNFSKVLCLEIKECLIHPEFGKTKLLNSSTVVSIKYPKKKIK